MCKLATGVAIAYDVTCTGCGNGMLNLRSDCFTSDLGFPLPLTSIALLLFTGLGGSYTLQQTRPSAGVASLDPDIVCSLGDTVTFNFPVVLSGYANLDTDCDSESESELELELECD